MIQINSDASSGKFFNKNDREPPSKHGQIERTLSESYRPDDRGVNEEIPDSPDPAHPSGLTAIITDDSVPVRTGGVPIEALNDDLITLSQSRRLKPLLNPRNGRPRDGRSTTDDDSEGYFKLFAITGAYLGSLRRSGLRPSGGVWTLLESILENLSPVYLDDGRFCCELATRALIKVSRLSRTAYFQSRKWLTQNHVLIRADESFSEIAMLAPTDGDLPVLQLTLQYFRNRKRPREVTPENGSLSPEIGTLSPEIGTLSPEIGTQSRNREQPVNSKDDDDDDFLSDKKDSGAAAHENQELPELLRGRLTTDEIEELGRLGLAVESARQVIRRLDARTDITDLHSYTMKSLINAAAKSRRRHPPPKPRRGKEDATDELLGMVRNRRPQ